MKISFAICTHNEGAMIFTLIESLNHFIQQQKNGTEYEIILIDDYSDDPVTKDILTTIALGYHTTQVYQHALNNDFATHKNFMNSKCTGDWIFNIDADEKVSETLLETISFLVETNLTIDAYWVPRVNTVSGLTMEHVVKWFWSISRLPGFRIAEVIDVQSKSYQLLKSNGLIISEEKEVIVYDQPIVCWPDYQMRLYRNSETIKWERTVHEQLVGYDQYARFPEDPAYAILHEKDIARQEKQNTFYSTIQR